MMRIEDKRIELSIEKPKMKDIVKILKKKGYEIKPYLLKIPAEHGFLVDDPPIEQWIFTATRDGEEQGFETYYLNVLEKEIKEALKEFLTI